MLRAVPIVLILLLAGAALPASAATNTAALRLLCLSVRFAQGTDSTRLFTLDLDTGLDPAGPNGELYPSFGYSDRTHFSFFTLRDPSGLDPVEGDLYLDVPESLDADTNGVADFYESARGIAGVTTAGVFTNLIEQGTVSARWDRAAGSTTGTCRLRLTGASSGPLPEFVHAIAIVEYQGTLRYVPAAGPVTGSVELHRIGTTEATLRGPVSLVRDPDTPEALMDLGAAYWTNQSGLTLDVSGGYLQLDPRYEEEYLGDFYLADGDLATAAVDYEVYSILVNDPNDADGDRVPDLSDRFSAPPRLDLAVAAGQLRFSITGAPGESYVLQRQAEVAASPWAAVTNLTLTTTPLVVWLPLPTVATTFWRLRSL